MTTPADRNKQEIVFLGELLELLGHGGAIVKWQRDELKEVLLANLIPDRVSAKYTAVFVVDMINDFCRPGGALYDPRIEAIIQPVVDLLKSAHALGVEKFILVQEGHSPDAKEFNQFPAHGVWGTEGAEVIDEITRLPFAQKFVVFRKNAIPPIFAREQIMIANRVPALGMTMEQFMRRLDAKLVINIGDCTDLCAREMPMYQKYWANQFQRDLRIIVPENCVATFHLAVETAKQLGLKSHPAEVMHLLALYEMSRHGIEVVKRLV